MQSMAEFVSSIETEPISVRGRQMMVRALSARETSRLSRLFPRPMAPLGPDPTKGSLAPPVPNENDPAHRSAFEEWFWQRKLMEVLLCADFVRLPVPGEDAGDRAMLARAVAELENTFTQVELQRIWQSSRMLFDERAQVKIRAALIADAEKEWESIESAETGAWTLPENYAKTVMSAKLEICRWYGMHPGAIDDVSPGLWEILLADYRFVKQAEARQGPG